MATSVDIGTVSSRGQIAIPSGIRSQLGLEDGSKVLFLLEEDTLLMRKVNSETFTELTKPFRKAKKKINEAEVNQLIHRMRR
jgi:antitoxin PrlF